MVINLLTNDVNRFDLACTFLLELFRAPIEGAIVCYILYWNIGPAGLIGVAFLLCFIPLQGLFAIINHDLSVIKHIVAFIDCIEFIRSPIKIFIKAIRD